MFVKCQLLEKCSKNYCRLGETLASLHEFANLSSSNPDFVYLCVRLMATVCSSLVTIGQSEVRNAKLEESQTQLLIICTHAASTLEM